ncbi:toll/interleukin-1 receptor domain-containing protein [Curtobacterium sp. 458]|uniref:toll/interleukin-1 receptor domain-containing protein n=1 Tax=Curtobacterium sp. 458 TaxID=3050069 RepID=UPI0025B3551F|nr:toll/interleukin-1 receptor domain-containing protein [Curtobacterium sp. 458]WJY00883.1 toll/interleukin-1 receptor domain-containing protein [Curtobacterium sp. 458]
MKVFISWSGRAEQAVAEALRDALKTLCVGQAEVFVSSQDIAKGERGVGVIEAQLASTDYGIIVLSAANHARPWVNYEGGALAKTLDSPVSTVLLDIKPSDIDGPLGPFQATRFEDQGDMKRLLSEVAVAASPEMPPGSIDVLFESVWPALSASWKPDAAGRREPLRSNPDMLAELIDRVRNIESQLTAADMTSVAQADALRSKAIRRRARSASLGGVDPHDALMMDDVIAQAAGGRVLLRSGGSVNGATRMRLEATEWATDADRLAAEQSLRALIPGVAIDWVMKDGVSLAR